MEGVEGVFEKPISGARSDGVEGFFKGVCQGMVGLVARPLSGALDFTSGTLNTIKRFVYNMYTEWLPNFLCTFSSY